MPPISLQVPYSFPPAPVATVASANSLPPLANHLTNFPPNSSPADNSTPRAQRRPFAAIASSCSFAASLHTPEAPVQPLDPPPLAPVGLTPPRRHSVHSIPPPRPCDCRNLHRLSRGVDDRIIMLCWLSPWHGGRRHLRRYPRRRYSR